MKYSRGSESRGSRKGLSFPGKYKGVGAGVNHVRVELRDVSKLSRLFRRSSGDRVSLSRSENLGLSRRKINEYMIWCVGMREGRKVS
jgi:hypothetical protein